ncbi:MAG: tyrosine-type recombinase/integrase [Deltaproteobacteria bacterium]|nr:tyrosine-type recombinase/integrase [Deltaproteobacteria bacterium]
MRQEWTLTPERFLSKEEAQHLRKTVQNAKDLALLRGTHRHHVKDYFMIAVFLETGLRLFELQALRPEDLFLKRLQPSLIVRRGKGGKQRVVHLTGHCKALLLELLELKKQWGEREDYLFVSQQNEQYTCRGIQKRVVRWLTAAGLKTDTISTHGLRHSYLTELLRKTKNLNLVKHQAGHSSLSVSSRYLHLVADDLQQLDSLYR